MGAVGTNFPIAPEHLTRGMLQPILNVQIAHLAGFGWPPKARVAPRAFGVLGIGYSFVLVSCLLVSVHVADSAVQDAELLVWAQFRQDD